MLYEIPGQDAWPRIKFGWPTYAMSSLILVGDGISGVGPDYFFYLPYEWVLEYCASNRNRSLRIARAHICANLGWTMHLEYKCTESELFERYGKLLDNTNYIALERPEVQSPQPSSGGLTVVSIN